MKKAIVTGSNGFIGSNVCKRLCADGIKVFAVVKDENENIDNIKNLSGIEIVYCELDEIETLADMISDRDIDVFYHFAWVGSAGSLRCDENVQLQNALWTARALRTADKMQCKKFVNAGSIMEKETYTAVYTQESKPGLPYIYGAGKLIARAICKPIANSLSIDLCWAVITNAYGVGELSPRFVNSTIRKIIANEPLQFTAATQNYDFIYIDDVARAFETKHKKTAVKIRLFSVTTIKVKLLLFFLFLWFNFFFKVYGIGNIFRIELIVLTGENCVENDTCN